MNNRKIHKSFGFTIVELLVVIVIIGVLASIAMLSYRGISAKAIETSMISDLNNSSEKLKIHMLDDGTYPVDVLGLNDCPTPATGNLCLKLSPSNSFGRYYVNNTVSPRTFCLTIKTTNIAKSVTNKSAPVDGSCPPSNLAVASKTIDSISLSWDSVPEAINYTLQRSSTLDFASHVDAIIAAGTTTYTSTGLTAGTYYYRLNVTDSLGVSAWSSVLTVKMLTVATFTTSQTWTVPAGTTSIQIEAWGAKGGSGAADGVCSSISSGGLGGYSKGNLTVSPGGSLYLHVGVAGGEASDARYGGNTLSDRKIVAGNGGNGGWNYDDYVDCFYGTDGGSGGGVSGGAGIAGGAGGTQTTGYGLGAGGPNPVGNAAGPGGGGAGYYGGYGGGGSAYSAGYGGGGGSGYIGGVTGGTTTSGVWAGSGKIVLSY